MSTNSRIGLKNEDGSIKSIYCHWDGYPEHNGKTLIEHYTSVEKINKLLDLGDISVLGSEVGEKHDFDLSCYQKKGTEMENWTVAYGRDRGEDGIEAIDSPTFEDFLKVADFKYNYIFDSGSWFLVSKNNQWQLVTEILKEK